MTLRRLRLDALFTRYEKSPGGNAGAFLYLETLYAAITYHLVSVGGDMHKKRPFFWQKIRLYFDENIPLPVIQHFNIPYWKGRIRAASAIEEGNSRQSDHFHYCHCQRQKYTLVTLDADFYDDKRYPFTHGAMYGIIIIRAAPSEMDRIVDVLSRVLEFLLSLPFPKAFLLETKIIAAHNGVVMRGRNASTKEIKSLHITAGVTTTREIRECFGW